MERPLLTETENEPKDDFPPRQSMCWVFIHPTLEKGMATYSSILAWKIPWTEEPGGPQSMGSLGVGHD